MRPLQFAALYFLLSSVFSTRTLGQDTTNTIGRVTIASPNAASLGKYGDIPVSYHTGIPQIGIPIYTVESGSLKLPISLSYHASGLKVQEPASWVGAGWSLNAGGAITRTVVGAPDDRGFFTSNVLDGYYTDYGFNSYLQVAAQSGSPYKNQITGQQLPEVPDDPNFLRGFKDGEPDLYFFNFGGYSGKFYFNDDRTPIFVPGQDFRVQPFVVAGQGFTGFIITTPDGVRYYFGQPGNNGPVAPIEATNPFTLQNGPANTSAAASAWYLNKIMSADGMDSITLNYVAENYSYYTISMSPVLDNIYNTVDNNGLENGLNVVKNLVAGVRLTGINFANGSIQFTPATAPRTDLSSSAGLLVSNSMADNPNTNSYALGSITITDNSGFCKKDSLYTSYFYDASGLPGGSTQGSFYYPYGLYTLTSDAYRLRLDSIQETSCSGLATVPPYKFAYFSEQVPRRLSFSIDHWGFPNGATNNAGLVPTYTVVSGGTVQTMPGANRDAAWPAMRAGSLQQITYPTGGSTVFEFEPKNTYTFTASVLDTVGLRSYVVAQFGQSQLTQTLNFTVTGPYATIISVTNNNTSWSPTFSIVDGNNVQQGGGPWLVPAAVGSTPGLVSTSFILPPGTYTGTLSYPSNAGSLTQGATAQVSQVQNVQNVTTQLVGGLRIKTISHFDGITSTPIVTSYNYTGGGSQSTGVLYSIPSYVQLLRSDIFKLVIGDLPAGQSCSPNGCLSCDGSSVLNITGHVYYLSPGSIRPMNNLQGENLGFNEVDVSQTGNGHSVYRYYGSNLWSVNINDVCQRSITQSSLCDPSIPSFPYPPIPFEFMRDELQYEGHFNESGHVLKESYYFPVYTPDSLITPGHISAQPPGLWAVYTEYNLQSAYKVKDSVVTNTYDLADNTMLAQTRTTYYGSAWHHQPTRTVSSTSTGDSLVSNTKYALDFRIPGCDNTPDSLAYFMQALYNDSL